VPLQWLQLTAPSCQLRSRPVLRRLDDVARVVRAHVADRAQEVLLVVLVDGRDRLLGVAEVAVGGVDEVDVDPRLVLGAALSSGATGFWLVHNHPRGEPAPSDDDREVTSDLRATAPIVGLVFHGHVVIGDGGDYALVRGFAARSAGRD
jgi:DNA repair protein RadC